MDSNKKSILIVLSVVLVAALLAWGGIYNYQKSRSGPVPSQPAGGNGTGSGNQDPGGQPASDRAPVNNTSFPLTLPDNFSISVYANNVPGARVMAIDGRGTMWVSQTGEGTISSIETKDGAVTGVNAVFRNLDRPHGLAIDYQEPEVLYFAEETKISKVKLYSEDAPQKIADLPAGSRHYTRTLGFGPDDRLYVSIGSTCDVCYEKDERLAAIYSMKRDGSDFKKVAQGLRNSVFFTWSYIDGRMWATEMGRDNLGDDVPPDEINVIESGPGAGSGQDPVPDYGWPVCYGQNIHDSNFDKNQYIQNPCNGKVPAKVELPAHSAPLGLAFVPEEGWPESYWYDLFVAMHGSWNRSEPTGYKIVRVKLDERGNYQGTEDFISGWLDQNERSVGRPVDLLIQPGGVLYASDDKAGLIYKITYNHEQ